MTLPEVAYIFLYLLKFTCIYPIVPDFTRIYLNDLHLPGFTKIYLNLPEFISIYLNLPELNWIYLNLPELT